MILRCIDLILQQEKKKVFKGIDYNKSKILFFS